MHEPASCLRAGGGGSRMRWISSRHGRVSRHARRPSPSGATTLAAVATRPATTRRPPYHRSRCRTCRVPAWRASAVSCWPARSPRCCCRRALARGRDRRRRAWRAHV